MLFYLDSSMLLKYTKQYKTTDVSLWWEFPWKYQQSSWYRVVFSTLYCKNQNWSRQLLPNYTNATFQAKIGFNFKTSHTWKLLYHFILRTKTYMSLWIAMTNFTRLAEENPSVCSPRPQKIHKGKAMGTWGLHVQKLTWHSNIILYLNVFLHCSWMES